MRPISGSMTAAAAYAVIFVVSKPTSGLDRRIHVSALILDGGRRGIRIGPVSRLPNGSIRINLSQILGVLWLRHGFSPAEVSPIRNPLNTIWGFARDIFCISGAERPHEIPIDRGDLWRAIDPNISHLEGYQCDDLALAVVAVECADISFQVQEPPTTKSPLES